MKTTMPRTSYDSSSSSNSVLNLQLLKKAPKEGGGGERRDDDEENEKSPPAASFTTCNSNSTTSATPEQETAPSTAAARNRAPSAAVSLLRSVLMAALPGRRNRLPGLGSRVTGTLFGHRNGHVQLAFQSNARSPPVVFIELAAPMAALVREMSSGLVRVALECERKTDGREKAAATPAASRLLEEPLWRAYCNGKKCGYAVRRECGPADWKVLRTVEPVSMGAGVIPGDGSPVGDIMYMRARFERVAGSRDSEAFYMINPYGGPELSVYFLRVQ